MARAQCVHSCVDTVFVIFCVKYVGKEQGRIFQLVDFERKTRFPLTIRRAQKRDFQLYIADFFGDTRFRRLGLTLDFVDFRCSFRNWISNRMHTQGTSVFVSLCLCVFVSLFSFGFQ
jgi:hypothetical protein